MYDFAKWSPIRAQNFVEELAEVSTEHDPVMETHLLDNNRYRVVFKIKRKHDGQEKLEPVLAILVDDNGNHTCLHRTDY